MKMTVEQLRSLIEDTLTEDMEPAAVRPRGTPPPLPQKKPAAPKPPNLKAFKANSNMMADAASRVKGIIDAGQGNTSEALRWIDKVVHFATQAKSALGGK